MAHGRQQDELQDITFSEIKTILTILTIVLMYYK